MFAHRNRTGDEGGGAFVELALVVPIFGLLLVGAAEFGRLAYADIEVSNAARAGVAYGAQNHATASDTSGMQTAATQDAPDVTSIAATASTFCTCSDGTVVTCANAPAKCLQPRSHNRICAGEHDRPGEYRISLSGIAAQLHLERPGNHEGGTLTGGQMTRRARRECGSSLVEMALAGVVLFSFIFGIMVMSLTIYSYHFISEAARGGDALCDRPWIVGWLRM